MAARKTSARKSSGRPDRHSVVASVERDLAEIAKRDQALADSALAASVRALAREIDDPDNSATSKSMCARALLDTLDRLRELVPDEGEADGVDDLTARRDARRSGSTAA